jgi:nicotinate-nucleotide pyrophosphorylase (carboxylating)
MLRESTVAGLESCGLDPGAVEAVAAAALREDLAYGPDVTTEAVVDEASRSSGAFVVRGSGVLAGVLVAAAVCEVASDGAVTVEVLVEDGTTVRPGLAVATVDGPTWPLLRAERSALNLLCHLSGVATATRRWVDVLAGTAAVVRDTRKTTPGLRVLEKYAVRCGGGVNHRMGLGDAALVKDNHVAATGSVAAALDAVRRAAPEVVVEVECDTLAQVEEALASGADLILLDNMDLATTRRAVGLARARGGVRLEASGGLSLENAAAVAATGVDYLAVGALTHSAPILDIGLDLEGADAPV